jgi:hypothetical protein
MKAMKKIVLGLGIASGAVLAAYLITGDRGHRTRSYIVQSERHTGRFKFVMKVLREGKFKTRAYITKRVDFETI